MCSYDIIFYSFFFFFNDTATTEIYTLSLHDALPIWSATIARPVAAAAKTIANGTAPFGTANPSVNIEDPASREAAGSPPRLNGHSTSVKPANTSTSQLTSRLMRKAGAPVPSTFSLRLRSAIRSLARRYASRTERATREVSTGLAGRGINRVLITLEAVSSSTAMPTASPSQAMTCTLAGPAPCATPSPPRARFRAPAPRAGATRRYASTPLRMMRESCTWRTAHRRRKYGGPPDAAVAARWPCWPRLRWWRPSHCSQRDAVRLEPPRQRSARRSGDPSVLARRRRCQWQRTSGEGHGTGGSGIGDPKTRSRGSRTR